MTKKKTNNTNPKQEPKTVSNMFSAASFAGVVDRYLTKPWHEPDELPVASPPVVAFYGFRGGAGRTTALAHVAAFMASRQVQVVVIDLDVEAPGIHHVLSCPQPEVNRGTVALLRAAAMHESTDSLRLAQHVLKSGLDLGTPIKVIPAGVLSNQYLEQLDGLGVPLWHLIEGASPLQALINQVKEELSPQLIFLDCRTGLSGLSASALFHVADLIVCFLPMSEQSLEGLTVFFRAVKAAKLQRSGRPEVLVVPSMVPEGPEGRQRLADWLIPKIEECYAEFVLGEKISEDSLDNIAEQVPVVRDGIEYRRGIALSDHVRREFAQLAGGVYQPLLKHLDLLVGTEQPTYDHSFVDTSKILQELAEKGDFKNLAFAESTDPKDIVDKFIQPSDFKAIVDRSTWYIVGAKGAGKSWLWTYLKSPVGCQMSNEMTYLAALGLDASWLSASALYELEREAGMIKLARHGTFWLFYSAKCLLNKYTDLSDGILADFRGEEKRLLQRLIRIDQENAQKQLSKILQFKRSATLAERLIRNIDQAMLKDNLPAVTLLFDGLDVGFGSDQKSLGRRRRYISALVEAIEPLRGASKRIFFKLFLREDLYTELNIQNQSHLQAATTELRWEPRDLWLLALNLVAASPTLLEVIHAIDPTAGPKTWPTDINRRQQLLEPLWGRLLESGNKSSTAAYIQRRTADGKDRLFPRTLVQLLAQAVEYQQTIESRPDRVLRSAAIQVGYKTASQKRVDDIRKEYKILGSYLDGLKNIVPTGTEKDISDYLSKNLKREKKRKGAEKGSLQAGPGGWPAVIKQLLEVGILREYKRARGDSGELKYEISLLYRPGLGIRRRGIE